MIEGYIQAFTELANGLKLTILVSMIAANLLLGIAESIYTGNFKLKAIADFLVKRILPYVISYFAVVIIALIDKTWEAAVTVVWGLILLALTGAILRSLKKMGINLPDFLAGKKAP